MKVLKVILIVLAIIIVALVLILGYFGFIPGLSKLFKADKPRDLGTIQINEKYRDEIYKKIGVKIAFLPDMALPEESLRFSGTIAQNIYLTQKDLNTLINDTRWRFYPVSSTQIKIHPDGTAEASGILEIGNLDGFAKAFSIPEKEIKKILEAAKIIRTNPPFYVRGKLSVTDNHADLSLRRVQIGKLPVPQTLISINQGLINAFIDARLKHIKGLDVKIFAFENGQAKFEGTTPEYTSFTEK